ncbi:MAG: hypothetical protein JWO78_135 [Micavibrio sp.]|nr:hypothetical protein [Micavibrio sp.]
MNKKSLNPTERSFEIRKFSEDFVSAVYIGDVSSPEGEGGRYAISSKLRDYHHGTMAAPLGLRADAERVLDEIRSDSSGADLSVIVQNLEHALSNLSAAYRDVSSPHCRVPHNNRHAIKDNLECSLGDFEQIVGRIRTLER